MEKLKSLSLVIFQITILLTGGCSVDSSDAPTPELAAEFSSDITSVRPGESIEFQDESIGEEINYEWTFEGGTPITSTELHPIVIYDYEGQFSATLKISNAFAEDTEVKTGYVTVEKSSKSELLSFTFEPELNDELGLTNTTIIHNNNVSGYIPFGSNYKLTPTFEISDYASLYINNIELKSGKSVIDFSTDVSIIVVAENGDENFYSINISDKFTTLDQAIQNIMNRYNIPGVQLGITRNEKLVYSGYYGQANVDNNTIITNESVFRIASISKTLTAIGILSLINDGDLKFDDMVFGEGAILGTTYGSTPYSSDLKQISIKHLLEHKAGGWTNDGNDPMFLTQSWSQTDIINYVIDNRSLDYTPGSTYLYSNFGYSLLGRVIEVTSGMTYADFIKNKVLEPSGISTMEIGKNTFEERWQNEVKYYNNSTSWSPYNPNVERMDAHGGWIASCTDLLKFIIRIDRNGNIPDILSKSTLNNMYFGYYNWFHSGALPGTSTVLSRVNDNFCFAVLSNGNGTSFSDPIDDFIDALNEEINTRTSWPEYDLFLR